jgi:hypothetical protein
MPRVADLDAVVAIAPADLGVAMAASAPAALVAAVGRERAGRWS